MTKTPVGVYNSLVRLIEVFADVCCPFTHVGLRRLAAFDRASPAAP